MNVASCRLRLEEIIRFAGSEHLKKADERMNEAVYRAPEGVEPAHAEEAEHMEDTSASADPTSNSSTMGSSSTAAAWFFHGTETCETCAPVAYDNRCSAEVLPQEIRQQNCRRGLA